MNNKKLPVNDIFLEAINLPSKHYKMLLKVGLPLIIINALSIIQFYYSKSPEGEFSINPFSFILLIGFAISLVMAIIGCHRIFLLGEEVVENTSLFHWTGNEIKYIGWWILIGFCAMVVMIPFTMLTPLMVSATNNSYVWIALPTLMTIPVLYLFSRWSLLLPSSAVGIHGKSLSWAWGLSSNNAWRLTLLVGLLPVLGDSIFSLFPAQGSLFIDLIKGALWLVIGVIEIGLLSLSYKFLVDNETVESLDA